MKDRLLVLLITTFWLLAGSLHAQQDEAPQVDEPTVVVVRFDGRLIKQVIDRQFSRSVPFRRCVLDAWCVGSADVTADVSLDFSGGTTSRIPITLTGLDECSEPRLEDRSLERR